MGKGEPLFPLIAFWTLLGLAATLFMFLVCVIICCNLCDSDSDDEETGNPRRRGRHQTSAAAHHLARRYHQRRAWETGREDPFMLYQNGNYGYGGYRAPRRYLDLAARQTNGTGSGSAIRISGQVNNAQGPVPDVVRDAESGV